MIVLYVLFGVYLLLLLGVALFSLYPARSPLFFSPSSVGVPQEEIELKLPKVGVIRGWWVDAKKPSAVVVLAHGYIMNRSELAPVAAQLHSWGCASLLIDLRGHGKSTRHKVGFGVREREEVAEAVRFVRGRHPGVPMILMGSSMGAAACVFACEKDPSLADALILDSVYGKLSEAIVGWWRFLGGRPLAAALYPVMWIAAPLAGLNPAGHDVARAIRQFTKPVLMIHGDQDDLALPSEALRVQGASNGKAKIVWMPGCGHSEGRWVHSEAYYRALQDFLQELAPPEAVSPSEGKRP
ncbi:MAG: alpha/beta fold hydrolase [Fimbriimonadaceae bacterium]|nr:MAG: alpha/beta fold hydrolase [Fimbriimonadaceae bacterium]